MFFDFDALYNEARGENFSSGKKIYYDDKVKNLNTGTVNGRHTVHGVVSTAADRHTSIEFDGQGGLYDYKCDCGHDAALLGPCRHVIATALAYEEKNPTIKSADNMPLLRSDAAAMSAVSIYNKRRLTTREAALGEVELVPFMEIDGGKVSLRFKLSGKRKQYVLKDISDFVTCMSTGQFKSYGVDLKFYHVKNSFMQSSRKLLDFLIECFSEKSEYYGNFMQYRDRITLMHNDVDDLFDIYEGALINFGTSDFVLINKRDVIFPLKAYIKNVDGGKEISLNINNFVFVRGKKRYYALYDSKIYFLTDGYYENLIDFIKAQELKRELFISEQDMSSFYNGVLAKISEYIEIDANDIDLSVYEAPALTAKVYIDRNPSGGISVKLETFYDETKFDILSESISSNFVRDWDCEDVIRGILSKYFDDFTSMTLTAEGLIFEFMSKGIPELCGYAEVFMTESMKKLRIRRSPRFSVGVKVRNNMLNLDLSADGYSPEEIKHIISAYRERKKFIKLDEGFVNLDDETLEALSGILDVADETDDGYALSRYYAPYINSELSQGYFALNRDSSFKMILSELEGAENADIKVPDSLAGIMRNYQKTGYRWLKTLSANDFGAILADDMGLGKSLQIISLILETKAKTIIVCPTTLMLNWVNEFNKFAPELKVLAVMGNLDERRRQSETFNEYDVVISSYDLVRRDIDFYEEHFFDMAVADEAQYIKNSETQNALSVKRLKSKHRFALTGTPVENNLSELWSIFDFVMPRYLGSYQDFKYRFETSIALGDELTAERLHKLIKPFILRRLKSDVLKELPPKVETVLSSPLEKEQNDLYRANLAMIKQSINEEAGVNRVVVLGMMTKLRQICCDPSLVYADYNGNSAKLESCMSLIMSAAEGGHKVLLFSQFTSMLEIIRKKLLENKITYYVLKGDTPKVERQRLVNKFNTDNTQVFLISLKAGGTGINLTGADIVIHYDPWWNESVMNQATDRAYRIGQDKSVQVYKLVLKDSIEEKIMELQKKKTALSGLVVGKDNSLRDIIEVLKQSE